MTRRTNAEMEQELRELRAELDRVRAQEENRPSRQAPPPIRLAPFWETQPAAWFAQAEVAMQNLSEEDKFAVVVRHLGESQAAEVSDLITSPPPAAPFTALKQKLLERLAGSADHRLRQLMAQDLGDQRPSALLRQMRTLAGASVGDALLRQLWQQRLPAVTRAVLVGRAELALDALAELADSVTEAAAPGPSVCAATAPAQPAPAELSRLAECMEALTQQVAALSAPRNREERRRDQPRQDQKDGANPEWCWYHQKFGTGATKCRAPCTFRTGNGAGGRN